MHGERLLIVNADDFGQDPGINAGVFAAHERGIVTSASLMVRWPAAQEAAAYAGYRSGLSLGLHVDLGEWSYHAGKWIQIYHVVDTEDECAVTGEIDRQIAAFYTLTGHAPTHLDSHQHAHRQEPVRGILIERASRLGVPLRECSPPIRYSGAFYGQSGKGDPFPQGITTASLLALLRDLPPGITEMGCHPGLGVSLETVYRTEREQETAALCNPDVRATLKQQGIRLCSFARDSEGRFRRVDARHV